MRYGASTLGASTSLIFPLAERKRLPHASRGSKHGHHGPRFPRVHRSLASSSISGPVLGRSPHPIELQQALACLDTIASGAHASNIAKRGAANADFFTLTSPRSFQYVAPAAGLDSDYFMGYFTNSQNQGQIPDGPDGDDAD